jgi:hypothetical protein
MLAALEAGRPLAADDAKAMAAAIRAAIAGDSSIEVGLQLVGQWRGAWRRRDLLDAVAIFDEERSGTKRDLAARIATLGNRYRTTRFWRDVKSGVTPAGLDGAFFQLFRGAENRDLRAEAVRKWPEFKDLVGRKVLEFLPTEDV